MKHYVYPMLLAALAMGTLGSCQDAYDLDEKLPPNFGTSLMDYLSENGYDNYRRLVVDLGYEEALSGATLKTVFAADDEAFARFYASNSWGVHNYDELSLAQKKMLLYSSMLDNSLQLMNLSSTTGNTGVTVGNAMRRITALSVYDTVPTITPAEMPDNNKAWKYYRDNNKTILCMKDMSTAPMMFFLEGFLQNNKITNEDINFIFNNAIDRKAGDAFVNGIKVTDGNLRSANGFIHRMQDVMLPLVNMSEIIANKPQTRTYHRFIERFSAPYYVGREVTNNYNLEYGTNVDSVFQKRYYAERSGIGVNSNEVMGSANVTTPDGRAVEASLKFDPGWNSFFSDDPNTSQQTVRIQKNMGVMLVPSDAALEKYWNEGTGKVLKDYYKTWDNVPDRVLAKLINNNMLNSWVNSVPSKFDGITNSTQDKMGITTADVDSVWLGCNGAIYLTNRVFSPTEYVSVSFPALINETMSILNWAIEKEKYGSYLNSMDARYSLFIPTNNALLTYVDPVSYCEKMYKEPEVWEFHYDPNVIEDDMKVRAVRRGRNEETGLFTDSIGEVAGWGALRNRLVDILDNHIVVGDIESGKEYYRTKNGGVLRVVRRDGKIAAVQNTQQMLEDSECEIERVYDQTKESNGEGNGKSYILDEASMQTTRRSVCDILSEREDCSLFFELLSGSELFETQRLGRYETCAKTGNIASFNNYHYTVYVPTNESLQAAIDAGLITTWDKIATLEESESLPDEEIAKMKYELNAFLRYHIQDNSFYIGMDYQNDGGSDTFERDCETAIMNEDSQKFYKVKINMTPNSLTVTGLDSKGNKIGTPRNVITKPGCYNLPAREYQIQGNSMATSAFAVVHMIDGPLFFK